MDRHLRDRVRAHAEKGMRSVGQDLLVNLYSLILFAMAALPTRGALAGMEFVRVATDEKAYLGSAAIGGGSHAKTIQMLVNTLDFGMDPQA